MVLVTAAVALRRPECLRRRSSAKGDDAAEPADDDQCALQRSRPIRTASLEGGQVLLHECEDCDVFVGVALH